MMESESEAQTSKSLSPVDAVVGTVSASSSSCAASTSGTSSSTTAAAVISTPHSPSHSKGGNEEEDGNNNSITSVRIQGDKEEDHGGMRAKSPGESENSTCL